MGRTKWTYDLVHQEALKYKTRTDFFKGCQSAYSYASKNGWLNLVCDHMQSKSKPYGYWTKDRCREDALKYNTRTEFQKNSVAEQVARKNDWLDEICEHMQSTLKPKGYWTKQTIQEAALKFETRKEFEMGFKGAYRAAQRENILNEVCSHMKVVGSEHYRCIYLIINECRKLVYVGLTFNFDKRISSHKRGTLKTTENIVTYPGTEYRQLTEYVEKSEAQKLEQDYLNQFKQSGYKILNRAKTGGLGTSKAFWTKERCFIEAQKFTTRGEFQKKASGAYDSALKNKWLNEICQHMDVVLKSWDKQACQEEAKKYLTRTQFNKGCGSAYNSARNNGWLDEICTHMSSNQKPHGYWTKERCQGEAKKYLTKSKFNKGCISAFQKAKRCGWLEEICAHMHVNT
ncbi:TPA: GIY-YIG nuclease family protein [Photobacterium damselae]